MREKITRISMRVTYAGQRITQQASAQHMCVEAVVQETDVAAVAVPMLAVEMTWQQMVMDTSWIGMTFCATPVDFSINQLFQGDDIVLDDAVALHPYLNLPPTDVVWFTEILSWNLGLHLADSISFEETINFMRVFLRDFAEDITLVESIVKQFDMGRIDEQVVLVDATALMLDKARFTEAITLTDVLRIGFNLKHDDTVLLVDHGVLMNQGYFDHTGPPDGYFLSDYFGDRRTW